MVLVIALNMWTDRRLLKIMTQVVEDIKDGNLDSRTGLSGDDEICALARAIDNLTQSMQDDKNFQNQLFAEGIHEIRNALMAIQSTVQAMVDEVYEPSIQRLQTLDNEVQRLSRIVDRVQILSSLQANAQSVLFESVNISDVMQEIIRSNTAYIEEAKLKLLTNIYTGIVVQANRDLITQAITNIIFNAVRYTPKQGTITIKLYAKEDCAIVQVQDTGIGIAEADTEKIFERFWRAENCKTMNSSGLGVGLAIVKEIVTIHGGRVDVTSKLGQGSIFEISIPLLINR